MIIDRRSSEDMQSFLHCDLRSVEHVVEVTADSLLLGGHLGAADFSLD